MYLVRTPSSVRSAGPDAQAIGLRQLGVPRGGLEVVGGERLLCLHPLHLDCDAHVLAQLRQLTVAAAVHQDVTIGHVDSVGLGEVELAIAISVNRDVNVDALAVRHDQIAHDTARVVAAIIAIRGGLRGPAQVGSSP
ncbi:MAG: hypothetical protein KatS3mg087_0860 [Patescibacteria group bacterium]|nr:MAG: hypothetical protein KatS3mg087_0860 [Patescibacteria group bacterium]